MYHKKYSQFHIHEHIKFPRFNKDFNVRIFCDNCIKKKVGAQDIDSTEIWAQRKSKNVSIVHIF